MNSISIYVFIYVCIYLHMYAYIYLYIYMYIYVCIYQCIHMCSVYIYIYNQRACMKVRLLSRSHGDETRREGQHTDPRSNGVKGALQLLSNRSK